MSYLLDTHALIYLGCGETGKMGKKALSAYEKAANQIVCSQISFWEIAIKVNIGKLTIPVNLETLVTLTVRAGIHIVPMSNKHIVHYASLPLIPTHKDPFDRYLVAVCREEKYKIISKDTCFDLYSGTVRIW